MRYRLRTLMIVMAIGPPVLAVALYAAWFVVVWLQAMPSHKIIIPYHNAETAIAEMIADREAAAARSDDASTDHRP